MYNSVLDERLLAFNPTLASIIGLNESIVLHQIHYWLNNIEKSENEEYKMYHHHCGRFWVYNTFEQWHNQFPYISIRTLKTTFKNLEDCGLLITGNFNKMGYDRTKWYSIDYNALETLENTHSANIAQSIGSKLPDEKCKNCTTNTIDFSNTSNKDYIKSTIHHFGENDDEIDYDILNNQIRKACQEANLDDYEYYQNVIDYFFRTYRKYRNEPHPRIKTSQLVNIVSDIAYGNDFTEGIDIDDYTLLIDAYFKTNFQSGYCDYHIHHFLNGDVRTNLFYQVLY